MSLENAFPIQRFLQQQKLEWVLHLCLSFKREFSGALSAAIITLPMAVAYGVTAFDSLGPAFRPQAALIGLNAAIFSEFLAALCGGTRHRFQDRKHR